MFMSQLFAKTYTRKRQLGIVKRTRTATIGVCELCDAHFESGNPLPDDAEKEVQAGFDVHRCTKAESHPLNGI
jgi:hypothetical protein